LSSCARYTRWNAQGVHKTPARSHICLTALGMSCSVGRLWGDRRPVRRLAIQRLADHTPPACPAGAGRRACGSLRPRTSSRERSLAASRRCSGIDARGVGRRSRVILPHLAGLRESATRPAAVRRWLEARACAERHGLSGPPFCCVQRRADYRPGRR